MATETKQEVIPSPIMAKVTSYIERLVATLAHWETLPGPTRLLTPVFPAFPQCYIDKLPESIEPVANAHLPGCFCHRCAPKLYQSLARHPKFSMHESLAGNSAVTTVTPKSEHRQVLSTFLGRLQYLDGGKLIKSDEMRREALGKELAAMEPRLRHAQKVYKDSGEVDEHLLPDLKPLSKLLSRLFYGRTLKDLPVYWCMKNNSAAHRITWTTSHGQMHIDVMTHKFLQNGVREARDAEETKSLSIDLVSLLLHEMLHALLDRAVCFGECSGSDEQQQLCKFLHTRMYVMFDAVWYGNKGIHDVQVPYSRHGPAYHYMGERLRFVAGSVLAQAMGITNSSEKENLLMQLTSGPTVQGKRCKHTHCKECEKMCIAHCYYDEKVQLILAEKENNEAFSSTDRMIEQIGKEATWNHLWSEATGKCKTIDCSWHKDKVEMLDQNPSAYTPTPVSKRDGLKVTLEHELEP